MELPGFVRLWALVLMFAALSGCNAGIGTRLYDGTLPGSGPGPGARGACSNGGAPQSAALPVAHAPARFFPVPTRPVFSPPEAVPLQPESVMDLSPPRGPELPGAEGGQE